MKPTNTLNSTAIESIAAWFGFLDHFLGDGPDSVLADSFVEGRLRVWHTDGWSPGYFTTEDEGSWQFVPDARER